MSTAPLCAGSPLAHLPMTLSEVGPTDLRRYTVPRDEPAAVERGV